MSTLHLRSTLRRALLLATRSSTDIGQRASLRYAAPTQNLQPAINISKFEKNIVMSPYSDCEFDDMTVTQKMFLSAMKWPDKIALVIQNVLKINHPYLII